MTSEIKTASDYPGKDTDKGHTRFANATLGQGNWSRNRPGAKSGGATSMLGAWRVRDEKNDCKTRKGVDVLVWRCPLEEGWSLKEKR